MDPAAGMSEEGQSEGGREGTAETSTAVEMEGSKAVEMEGGAEGGSEGAGLTETAATENGGETSYSYEELKSGPEVVNMSPDTYLELQYPSHAYIL